METTKNDIAFSTKHKDLSEKIEAGLKKSTKKLIAETKASSGYLVISDSNGNIKKIPAKDL